MLQTPAAQELFKLTTYVVGKPSSLTFHLLNKRRVVLLNDPIEQRLLGAMALVSVRIPVCLRRIC